MKTNILINQKILFYTKLIETVTKLYDLCLCNQFLLFLFSIYIFIIFLHGDLSLNNIFLKITAHSEFLYYK